ncbi:hypothetical protein MTO96_029536 [Rhipicephalus appendiculatus]
MRRPGPEARGSDSDAPPQAKTPKLGKSAAGKGEPPPKARDTTHFRSPAIGHADLYCPSSPFLVLPLFCSPASSDGRWLPFALPLGTSAGFVTGIDRAYIPDLLLPSVVSCEVLALPDALARSTDHAPLVTTVRGTPGPRPSDAAWRLDPAILKDDTSTQSVKTRLEETIRATPRVTPAAWDSLKAAWKTLLQQEGSARKKRITTKKNELLRRMRIVQSAEVLTACTRDYLHSLRVQYDKRLWETTRETRAARATPGEPPEVDLREVSGNGSLRIAEVKRPDGTLTADPAEIEATFFDHFKSAFREPDSDMPRPEPTLMEELCKSLRRLDEDECVTLCGPASIEELRGAIGLERLRRAFGLYADASGAQLNQHTSKALLFGPFPADAIGNIETVCTVKVLGLIYTCEGVAASTWTRVLDRALQLTERARLLDLTLRENALAVKTSISALASYASRVAVMPARTASQLTKLTNSFLWDGKPPPVKRNLLQLAVTEGGTGRATSSGEACSLYWSSVRDDWLDVDRHPGPSAESPAPFYKAASATMRMLKKEAPGCEVDADPPARIVEALTWHQLSVEDKQRAMHAKRELTSLRRGAPRETQDFAWKMAWKVLPTRQRLNKLGIVPDARCPNCRSTETQIHALYECPAAKPVWRMIAHCFGIRAPPGHKRIKDAFAKLVVTVTLFVIWQRRSLAEARRKPVRATYPAVARIRRLLWAFLPS